MQYTEEWLSYTAGNEHNPCNPLGRHHLEIARDGAAWLDHWTIAGHLAWEGTVSSKALEDLRTALQRAEFPQFPSGNLLPDTTLRVLEIRDGTIQRSAELEWSAALLLAGYGAAFAILDSIIWQMSQQTLKLITAPLPDTVVRVRGLDDEGKLGSMLCQQRAEDAEGLAKIEHKAIAAGKERFDLLRLEQLLGDPPGSLTNDENRLRRSYYVVCSDKLTLAEYAELLQNPLMWNY